jgi:hypothetical protein
MLSRWHALHAALALMVAPLLFSQTAPQRPTTAPSHRLKPGSMEGTVIDSVTKAPIPRATVGMASGEGFSRIAVTDEAGKFQIPSIEPGDYDAEFIRAEGFLYERPRPRVPVVTVAEGQHVTDVVLQMTPLCVISGRVADEDGEPLARASVALVTYAYSSGVRTLNTANGATTDDRGQYRIFGVKPGRYFAEAWLPAGQAQGGGQEALPANLRRSAPELRYGPVFYPNGNDPSQGMRIEAPAGREVSAIDFRLPGTPVYRVRGKLQGAPPEGSNPTITAATCTGSGAPLASTPTSGAIGQYSSRIDSAGRFDFGGVAPGVYCMTFRAMRSGLQFPLVYTSDTFTVTDHELEEIAIRPAPTFSIAGVMQVDGQAGPPPAIRPYLVPVGNNLNLGTTAGENGAFTLQGAAPGAYRFGASASGSGLDPGIYVKSVHYGEQDVTEGLVAVVAADAALTVILGADGGQLTGVAQADDGQPAANVPVTIAPADRFANREDLLKTARTDSTGSFSVAGLAPGEYKVYAWGDPDVPMAEDAVFRSEFSGRAAEVTIGANGQASVQVKLISADEIRKVKEKY